MPQPAFNSPGLYKTPIVDPQTGLTTWVWTQAFQQAALQLQSPVSANVPADSAASAVAGQLATDGDYLYVAIGANTWKRVLLTNF